MKEPMQIKEKQLTILQNLDDEKQKRNFIS